jgi:uncharacterized protein (UPF0262 family)
MTESAASGRLIAVEIDPASLERGSAEAERELAVAIADLVGDNIFQPEGLPAGQFRLKLARAEQRLQLTIAFENGAPAGSASISLVPFRKLVADYFLVCDSYYAALRTATPARIEAIDMGRRAIHDEASALLRERLRGNVNVDLDTARRLFTLLCALHWKG